MTQYFTKEGLEKLKSDLEHLKSVKRKEVSEKLKQAIEFGDISENAAYEEAKEEQSALERKILELEEAIREAVVTGDKVGTDTVQIGSTVHVSTGKKEARYTIVGATEANPMEQKISSESPFGKALLGKKKGEKVFIETPDGKTEYKILDIG